MNHTTQRSEKDNTKRKRREGRSNYIICAPQGKKTSILYMIQKSTVLSPARETDGANFHGGCHHQWSFWRVADGKLVVHEAAFNYGFVLQHNLVTITAFKALLIPVALVRAVLHLLEVPYHAEFSHRRHKMPFLFTILSNLKEKKIREIRQKYVKLYPSPTRRILGIKEMTQP